MATAEGHRSNTGKYITVYVIMLVIAVVQFVIGLSGGSFPLMLSLAVVEGALALLFFMHLADNHGLLWFVVIFTVFALLAMQYGWTDSFRISGGVPWAK